MLHEIEMKGITAMDQSKNSFPCYGVIPARYGSTRFPGKPLAMIFGKPMIWHVYIQALNCPHLKNVIVATDDERILSETASLGVPALMTRSDHRSGTDRVLEASRQMDLPTDAVVVNIQGDEPALEPVMISELVGPFKEPNVQVTTLACRISSEDAKNADQVKVVFDARGKALYFSRSLIPYHRENPVSHFYGHIGLYAFRLKVLENFASLRPSPLERVEKLEQLRMLENNIPIKVVVTQHKSVGVDKPEDILTVSKLIKERGQASYMKALGIGD